jgi:hypothetical protein
LGKKKAWTRQPVRTSFWMATRTISTGSAKVGPKSQDGEVMFCKANMHVASVKPFIVGNYVVALVLWVVH